MSPPQKKKFFWGEFSQICLNTHRPTHPRVFVRFGNTKGEIQVKKVAIFGLNSGFLMGLDLVWVSATPPIHIWERSPK